MASTSVVFPWSTWATMATLRRSSRVAGIPLSLEGNRCAAAGVEGAVVGRPRDLDAYEQLVREHQVIAFRTAFVITGSAADAEEVVQDAFVKAYRARGRFRAGAPFRPWLLAIVANEARNRRRSAGRREALVLRAAGAASGDAAPSPEAVLVSAEDHERLLRAVNDLGDDHRPL